MQTVRPRAVPVLFVMTMSAFLAGQPLAAQEEAAPVGAPEVPAVEAPPPAPVAQPPAAVPAVEVPAPAPAAPVAGDVPDVIDLEAPETAVPSGSKSEEGLISVSLDNVELADVVRLFTRLSNANIICNATNLQGKVTANLQDVEWQPAFKAILERHNLMLQEDLKNKGIWYVDPRPVDAPEPWITESFKLDYLKSSEAAEMLTSLLGIADSAEKAKPAAPRRPLPGRDDEPIKEEVAVVFRKEGRVVSYPSGNIVVVSTTEQKMEEVRTVLKAVDVPRQQVYIEAKIVELVGDAGKNIGLDWSMLDGYKVSIGNLKRDYAKTKTRQHGSADMQVGEASAVYDHTGKKLSTESSPAADFGSAIALAPASIAIGPSQGYTALNEATPGAATWEAINRMSGRFSNVTDVRTAIFEADALSLVLSALQTSEDAFFVANPKVIVANEEKAIIDMTTKTPYITIERTAGTEESPGDKFATKIEVIPGKNEDLAYIEQAFFTHGTKLDVIPRINNPSNITVVVEPTISTATAYTTLTGDGAEVDTGYPEIHMKRVKTTFSLGNGQTAVIGGLTTTSDNDVTRKIPLLGDIPILGKYLFSHTSKQKTQRETIIFVTVGIIDSANPEMALAVPEASELIQKRVDAQGRLYNKVPDDAQVANEPAAEAATK